MTRYALRILPTWPWTVGQPGDIVGAFLNITNRTDIDELRRNMPNGEHYEVVQVDEHEQVIEP